MRANGHAHRLFPQGREPLPRHPQFRLRAAPEQIGRRGGNHQKIWFEALHLPLHFLQAEFSDLRVYQQGLVPGGADFVKTEQQFQRIVRLLATEVGGAGEIPIGVNQGESHAATPGAGSRAVPGTRSVTGVAANSSRFLFHQPYICCSVWRRLICGCQPVSRRSLAKSVTYTSWSPGRMGQVSYSSLRPVSCLISSISSSKETVFSGPPPTL